LLYYYYIYIYINIIIIVIKNDKEETVFYNCSTAAEKVLQIKELTFPEKG